jgi:hypothetical protein
VNRLWKLFFGVGLVRTLDDFGAQGERPTHPDLLDWLAVEFMECGWDVKHIVKLMVMSETYRQSSTPRPESLEGDPKNRWWSRQSRFRLPAEMIRDNALAVCGLLSETIGGPSVKPYQPEGYWAHLNFPKRTYEHDHGEDLYRRGLYTFWCRTFPHPSLVAFDAPSREECTVERVPSNTPLQALVLLNDPIYIEAARVLGERIHRQGGLSVEEQMRWAFRHTLQRDPIPIELELVTRLFQRQLERYQADPSAAQKVVSAGERPVADDLELPELAAATAVARVLLNLHETVTRY